MCGLGGVLRTDGRRTPNRWLDAIDARIAHRGPDGEGRFRDRARVQTADGQRTAEVTLVHRRLSIIDLADGGQPMVSPHGPGGDDDLVAVVFNGCLYNHRPLRAELEAAGHRFATDHSDTEVLLHGYRQWGLDLARRLEGMYAFAVWDRARARLVLARDLFGRKPLYLGESVTVRGRRVVVFASDAKVVADLLAGAAGVEPDPGHRLARYLQLGYVPGGGLSLDGGCRVDAVAPGETRCLAATAAEDETTTHPVEPTPDEHGADAFEARLDEAVRRRLEADVPLGCFLSGGIDSSLVARAALRHRPGLRTFGVRMPDPRYDESHHAERVAAHLGTDHTTLDVAADPAGDLVHLVGRLGQPFGDSSLLPTCWVSRAARAHVAVALSGDGGDELFCGYDRYLAARPLARHHRLIAMLPPRFGRGAHPKSLRHRLGRLAACARDWPAMGLLALESLFTGGQLDDLLGPGAAEPARLDPGDDALETLRAHDLSGYLCDDLMRKVDAASMDVALEVRCPFLDRDLAAAAVGAATDRLMPGGRRKGLLRDIARRHLPPDVCDRPKMGFAIPVGRWFRTDFGRMRTLLLDTLRSRDPFGNLPVSRTAAIEIADEHLAGAADHGQRLFTLLTLAIWARGAS
ncbi:MAG: asparagine synthase (glutamine-hydrolyzing) [Planctomycetota bacterium]|jgi:asparagine synthase (glutamine-hydrolysing)